MNKHVFTLIVSCWGLLACVSMCTSADYDDLYKQVAKEYKMPVEAASEILSSVDTEIKLFPIPHTVWYFTTQKGDDIKVASDYFGGDINLDEDTLNEYFWLDQYTEVYKDWYKRNNKR